MHIHIMGICGTFMGGMAAIGKALGHRITGSDQNVYPPMSTQLAKLGIELNQGWDPERIAQLKPDLVLVGNALSRGNPMVEALLESKIPFDSAPAWLHREVLSKQWVVAIAGTHGKTTTTSMTAWILEQAGLKPGFLIGGKPAQFDSSARVGGGKVFVIEADEYDTAFFDKRSKFVHYWPKTCVINNLEFDHADIFDSLEDIQKQMHHMVRTVSPSGLIIYPRHSPEVIEVLEKGCWSITESIGAGGAWGARPIEQDFSKWAIYYRGHERGIIEWSLFGEHQVQNAMAAIAAAHHAGVEVETAIEAIQTFKLPKRRMELIGNHHGVCLYDDFAHHPTAIHSTLQALKARVNEHRVGVILDLRSNTMQSGVHTQTLKESLALADSVAVYQSPQVSWDVQGLFKGDESVSVFQDTDDIVRWFGSNYRGGDHWVIMSNGGFEGIHKRLTDTLKKPQIPSKQTAG